MDVQGIHHATMVSSDAQRTVDFYTGLLGFRLIKQTVNFDQPDTRHLYFSDPDLRPASILSFFVWPEARRGFEGIGGTHHIALATRDQETLLRWKRWLTDHDIRVWGPYNRVYFTSIYFNDPDGVILEIATEGPGFTVDEPSDQIGSRMMYPPLETMAGMRDEEAIELETWQEPIPQIDPEMILTPVHHISAIGTSSERTVNFYNEVVGLRTLKQTVNFDNPDAPHLYFGLGEGDPGSIITYFIFAHGDFRPFRMGTGVSHHFALRVPDEDALIAWKTHLTRHGVESSDVRDRKYFKSIYFHDPDGQIVELATDGPGFLIDEDMESLGTSLQLPDHLEPSRKDIEPRLKLLTRWSAGDE